MSEMRANKLSSQSGLLPTELHRQAAAKGLVAINGTGTIAIIHSMNISGLVDVGVGQYQANFSSPFSSGNCTHVASGNNYHNPLAGPVNSAGSVRFDAYGTAHTIQDASYLSVASFGDLA